MMMQGIVIAGILMMAGFIVMRMLPRRSSIYLSGAEWKVKQNAYRWQARNKRLGC